MRYGPFIAAEYECLNDDYEGPRFMYDLIQLEIEKAECENVLKNGRVTGPRFIEFRSQIERQMLSMIESRPKGCDRGRTLAGRAKELRTHLANNGKTMPAYTDIFFMYAGWDSDSFRKDFAEYVHTDDEKLRDKSISANKKRAEDISKNLADVRKSVDLEETYFRFVPQIFRGRVITNDFSRADMADFILRSFVGDYLTRSRCFAVPVTIYGISIATLPDKQRRIWQNIHKQMKIEEINKVAMYRPRRSGIKTETKKDEVQQQIPGVFSKQ